MSVIGPLQISLVTILSLASLAALLYLFRRKILADRIVESRSRQDSLASPTLRIQPGSDRAQSEVRPMPEEERLAQEAAEVRSRWDQKRKEVEQTHADEMRPIKEKLAKARERVDRSGVGDAACDILRVAWHWPSRSKREDWKIPTSIEEFDGGATPRHEHGGREGKWLGWMWEGEPYRLELAVSPNYTGDDTEIGSLKLEVDGELVMDLDVSQRLGTEYNQWSVFGVSAFHAGTWMTKLNELAGRLRIAENQWHRDHEKSFYGDKADNWDA